MTKDGELVALDAKINFDDNADVPPQRVGASSATAAKRIRSSSRPSKAGLNYVSLDGDIGCLVNGAGLAMATMDIIKLHGGSPANFLDVGGGANKEQVTKAFRMILRSPR